VLDGLVTVHADVIVAKLLPNTDPSFELVTGERPTLRIASSIVGSVVNACIFNPGVADKGRF